MDQTPRKKNKQSKAAPDPKDREIAELKRRIEQAQIELDVYHEIINVAEAKFHIPLKKILSDHPKLKNLE